MFLGRSFLWSTEVNYKVLASMVSDSMLERVFIAKSIFLGEDILSGGKEMFVKFSSNFVQLIECEGLSGAT